MENWFVVVMGLATVFVVLTLLILMCSLLGTICRSRGEQKERKTEETQIPNRAEFVAAVSAAIAEAGGTDASAIRIVSIKKV